MIKELSFIVFEEEDGTPCVGFNRYAAEGYIDDGHKWSEADREAFAELIAPLDLEEVGTFTYQYFEDSESIDKLRAMGMKEQDPVWTL